jgi:hypothetical protein
MGLMGMGAGALCQVPVRFACAFPKTGKHKTTIPKIEVLNFINSVVNGPLEFVVKTI